MKFLVVHPYKLDGSLLYVGVAIPTALTQSMCCSGKFATGPIIGVVLVK